MPQLEKAPISVLIPCFRCAGTIMRAIDSIVHQTQKPVEIILVDDASDDGTLEILRKLATQYLGWVKVIALPYNQGAANARNVAWNLASQPFIALLDADDAWHPQKIEIQYKFMLDNPEVTLCGHDKRIITRDIRPSWPVNDCGYKRISKNRLLFSNPFVTPSVMIKRDVTFRFNASKRYMEDYFLWLQIIFDNCKVVKLTIPLVAIYKPMYGASGLSSNMWAMEKSELNNYWLLFDRKKIGCISTMFFYCFSFAKYLRRLVIVNCRRILFVRN